MNRLYIIVGTRPNFIKVTQFKKVAEGFSNIEVTIIHTGQHYDNNMAEIFFDQFGLRPDIYLNIKPDHPGKQIAETINELIDLFSKNKPSMVLVVGDVNSTIAAALAANKCNIPVGHLESGLRSFDKSMPEEHNRIVADHLCNLHFITEDTGTTNLRAESIAESGISFVGNTMIDTLIAFKEEIDQSEILNQIGLNPKEYILVTLHRPSNVDSPEAAKLLIDLLEKLLERIKIVFPLHPRTKKQLIDFGMFENLEKHDRITLLGPTGYFDFQKLIKESVLVLTDSGGIQEETTFLKKPCLTLRPNTERPITITQGTNELLPFKIDEIAQKVDAIIDGNCKEGEIPKFWDGASTKRVLERIELFFEQGY